MGDEVGSILLDDFLSRPIPTNLEGITPDRRSTNVDIIVIGRHLPLVDN